MCGKWKHTVKPAIFIILLIIFLDTFIYRAITTKGIFTTTAANLCTSFSRLLVHELLAVEVQTFKMFQGPRSVINDQHIHALSRRHRSSDCSLLDVPRVCTCFSSRSFAVAAPTTWNSLPLHIRNSSYIFGFHRQLKTFRYNLAFDPF